MEYYSQISQDRYYIEQVIRGKQNVDLLNNILKLMYHSFTPTSNIHLSEHVNISLNEDWPKERKLDTEYAIRKIFNIPH